MYLSNFVALAQPFSKLNPETGKVELVKDKNGKQSILLNVQAGKSVNRTVVSGTVAEQKGFEIGKFYYVEIREKEANDFGRQFNINKLAEISFMDALKAKAELGEAEILNIDAKVEKEQEVSEKETKTVFED